MDNEAIAELLARAGEESKPPLQKAFRRAARAAFRWPEEAACLREQGRSLTELPSIGPYLEKIVAAWLDDPPDVGPLADIRQNFLTLPKARALLARHPEWQAKLRGDLQMHTRWSDGTGTIREMAEAASERGYEYIAITDHAKGLKIAGGIDEAELRAQALEIDGVNQEVNVRVLRSVELNLNPHGVGDLDPKALVQLDIVLGAFHSALRRTDDQTERYLAALRNPDVHILGHPRGRIYDYRMGLSADWKRVFALAAELDKAVEIDSYPDRQDLDVKLLRVARSSGVRISLGTDAHHPWQLEFITLGLAAALKARIPADRIINFMPLGELQRWVASLRKRR